MPHVRTDQQMWVPELAAEAGELAQRDVGAGEGKDQGCVVADLGRRGSGDKCVSYPPTDLTI